AVLVVVVGVGGQQVRRRGGGGRGADGQDGRGCRVGGPAPLVDGVPDRHRAAFRLLPPWPFGNLVTLHQRTRAAQPRPGGDSAVRSGPGSATMAPPTRPPTPLPRARRSRCA